MPRPNAAKQRPSHQRMSGVQIVPIPLPRVYRDELIDILNCESEGQRVKQQIIASIEEALGLYPHFREELDEMTRPARRVSELNPLFTNLRKALKQFRALSEDASQDILNQAADAVSRRMLNTFPIQLKRMIQALAAACKHLGQGENRHGNTHLALKITVASLNSCFSRHYQFGEGDKRPSLLIEFIRTALKACELGSFSIRTIERHLKSSPPFS